MKRLFYLLFCLGVLSCQSPSDQAPDNMIPEDRMVRILADIHSAEAIIESTIIYPDTALMVFNQEQLEIFERHGVTKAQFEQTYDYYLENLIAMDALYETVVDTLSLRQSMADSLMTDKPERPVAPIYQRQFP